MIELVNPWQVAQQAAGYVRAAQESFDKATTFNSTRGLRALQRAASWDDTQGAIKLAGEQARLLLEKLKGWEPDGECTRFVGAVVVELTSMYTRAGDAMRAELRQLTPESWNVQQ